MRHKIINEGMRGIRLPATRSLRTAGFVRAAGRSVNRLFDRLLMPTCPLCLGSADRAGLCQSCRRSLPGLSQYCQICAIPLLQDRAVCGACLTDKPAFNRVVPAFPYAPPIDWLIHNIKYRGRYRDIRPLAFSAIARFEQEFKRGGLVAPDCFIPVPLHPMRLRARGFNQALELARFFARHFNSRVERRCIEKPAAREQQTTLPARIRKRNARGAYVLRHQPDADRVVIVDDVMTTGATANEIARLLRRAGLRRIDVWVIARTGELLI